MQLLVKICDFGGCIMFRKFALAAFLTFPLCATAAAATVSGFHQTAAGKVVNLSGLEWLTWDQTTSLSRTQIENGTGNTFFAEGWRYATRREFETLFDSLWGGLSEGWHSSNQDGTTWLLNVMDRTTLWWQNISFGSTGECGSTNASCLGHYVDGYKIGGEFEDQGWFENDYGLSYGVSAANGNRLIGNDSSGAHYSHALVRTAVSPVPVPLALPLLAGGLGFLGFMGWRRKRSAT
ncbi:MAG: hypothetical protein AAGA50_18370 [Pseudomonadota bacterium]